MSGDFLFHAAACSIKYSYKSENTMLEISDIQFYSEDIDFAFSHDHNMICVLNGRKSVSNNDRSSVLH